MKYVNFEKIFLSIYFSVRPAHINILYISCPSYVLYILIAVLSKKIILKLKQVCWKKFFYSFVQYFQLNFFLPNDGIYFNEKYNLNL